ncbi:hypothetical protein TTRE_0000457901 [Trichuris trichiura]|uniref:Uncharacterized protein n=1 Tax=Trichuris trichiura TaxID=36087 RepID=A0A077Z9I6_TRITR|nr:hypothetical protein TTRE_0000457901 [Trichuris trichiura]
MATMNLFNLDKKIALLVLFALPLHYILFYPLSASVIEKPELVHRVSQKSVESVAMLASEPDPPQGIVGCRLALPGVDVVLPVVQGMRPYRGRV